MSGPSNDQLLERLEALNKIGVSLSIENNIAKVFEQILVSAQKLTNADAGSLYLINNNELEFCVFANDTYHQLFGGTTGKKIPYNNIALFDRHGMKNLSNVASFAAHNKEVINIADAYHNTDYDFSGTKTVDANSGYHSQSFLTIPLMDYEQEVVGILQLINRKDEQSGEITTFNEADQRLAESLASQAAIRIKNHRLLEEKLQQERVKKELDIASTIQHGLIPKKEPDIPGVELAFFFKPAKDVGGDFFDYFVKEDKSEIFITVADAAGKGLPACLYSLSLRSLLRSAYNVFDSPADILKNANNLFQQDAASSANFATTVTAAYQPNTRTLTYASCGHPASYLRRHNGQLQELISGGMTLGIVQQQSIPQISVQIEPGDLLLIYTDGLTDAMNLEDEFFGEARVEKLLSKHKNSSAKEMITILADEITRHQQGRSFFDDTTLVAISFK